MVVTRHVSQKNAVDRVQPDKSRKNPPERRRIAVTSAATAPACPFLSRVPHPAPARCARPSLSCFLLCSFRRLISNDGINQQDYHKWRNDPPKQPVSGTFPVWRMFVYAGREGPKERTNFGRDARAAANFPSLRHRKVGRKFFPRFSRIHLQ